jgi:cell division protein FtsB
MSQSARGSFVQKLRQTPFPTSIFWPARDLLHRVNVNLGIWDKLTKLAIFCLFILGFVAVAVWYLPLIRQNERMRSDLLKWQTRVQTEQDRERDLRNQLEAAKSNPKTIERFARAKLGYAKPGETVIRFEEPNPRR